ncbi:hypothetical protein [Pseudaestuariivita atlantica]|uniref:DUF560 domain-containing protein n=1 Tax=Pseudaestuariivita atlantica TaxID=1317121 RepID=A0A0L1JR15_9RHOB|nr:hypothetical protein [Pseudaestuariivita atlantica]KNG94157.1 hypothetical protein ATO11_07970 [Pseudaestuariivita atlantica]
MIRSRLLAPALAGVTALALAVTTTLAETVTLTPAQMRVVASESVVKGLTRQGYDLASALLKRDSDDVEALLIHSRAARDLGKLEEAETSARRAWSLAADKPEKYAAAKAIAQALSSQRKRTRAQLWLRRAAHHAPSDLSRNLAIRDFQYVRSRNPWSTHLSFNIAPSDNINNGSQSQTTELFGLPLQFALSGTSRALSGTEVSLGFDTRYRLVETERGTLHATFGLDHRTYALSAEARRQAPGTRGSDFNTTQATVGLKARTALTEDRRLNWSGNLDTGRAWYAGDPYLDFVRVGTGLSYGLSPRSLVQAEVTQEWQTGIAPRPDADIARLRAGFAHLLPGGSRIDLSLGWEESQSAATYLDYTRRDASLRLALGKPVWGTQVSFGVNASEKHHDMSGLTGGVRTETTFGADMTVVFPKLDMMGFVPSVTLRASRTDGTIDLLDKSETGIGFGIKSAF